MKRRDIVLGGVALAGVLASTHEAAAAEPAIRIANLDIGPFMPVAYVAKLAKKYGIKVKIFGFRNGPQDSQAVSGGSADIGVGGVEAAVIAIAGGAPAKIIAGGTTGGIGWMARKGTGIKKVADLKGKKFGTIPGLHELVMKAELTKHDLTFSERPGADVQVFYFNSPPNVIAALRSGDVDAASAPAPFYAIAEADGYAIALPPPYDTPLGHLPRAIFARNAFLSRHPTSAQHFVDAYVASMKVFRDDPKTAENFVVNDALKGAMDAKEWKISTKNLGWNVALSNSTVQAFIDLQNKFGMIHKQMKAADITNLALLDKAKTTVGW